VCWEIGLNTTYVLEFYSSKTLLAMVFPKSNLPFTEENQPTANNTKQDTKPRNVKKSKEYSR
jgi:hypothetical protein